jgi:hypothetical protein
MRISEHLGRKALVCGVAVGLVALAVGLRATNVPQDRPRPESDEPPTAQSAEDADTKVDERENVGVTAHDADATRLIDAWEKLLTESKFATVKARVRRTQTKLDLSKEDSAPVTTQDIVLRAEAVMKRDANWLLVWDDTKHDQPVLKIQCVEHKVREDLWEPATKQYRVQKYHAPTAFGANDTQYENACMIANFLSTSLGVGFCEEIDLERMREGQALPELVEIDGKPCRMFRYVIPHNDEEFSSIREYWLDPEGRLVRWRGVQTTTKPNKRVEIAITQEYDWEFSAEVPAQAEAPPAAQTAPEQSGSPAQP